MRVFYGRKQSASIYDLASIDDLPFEVMQKILIYLWDYGGFFDLLAASQVTRAWWPIIQELNLSRICFMSCVGLQESWMSARVRFFGIICGLNLKSIIFGFESFSIERLELDLNFIELSFIEIVVGFVSSTLGSLLIECVVSPWPPHIAPSSTAYAILDKFFSSCAEIRTLKLSYFGFGVDPASMTQVIKKGFSLLRQLSLVDCNGNIGLLLEGILIPNLWNFQFNFGESEDNAEMLSNVFMKSRSIYHQSPTDWLFRFVGQSDQGGEVLSKFKNLCRCLTRRPHATHSIRY
jgi:hypothetical protein